MGAKKFRILDLFCGAGGASMGYYLAGFDVVGVDIKPQKNYPFEFYQANALDYQISGFDAIHASPPCQAHTSLNVMWNAKKHKCLIKATRKKLKKASLPYIIENVPGAPLINPIILCGTMFNLGSGPYDLRRHRLFELNFNLERLDCNHKKGKPVIGIYGDHVRCMRRKGDLPMALGKPLAEDAMEIDWMTFKELSQSIPPAYTEFIGNNLKLWLMGHE